MLLFDRCNSSSGRTLSVLSVSALSFLFALYAAPAKNAGLKPAATATVRPSQEEPEDRKSTRLNSSHVAISYAVFCLKKKKTTQTTHHSPTSVVTTLSMM